MSPELLQLKLDAVPAFDGFTQYVLAHPTGISPHAMRVAKFMALAEQALPTKPTVPDGKIRELRVRLLFEELLEFCKAAGVTVFIEDQPLRFDELIITALPESEVDLVEAADGLGDISVVNTGGMLAFGILDETLLREIDWNNLRKFGPGGYKDVHGKWRKPPDHKPPDVEGVLRRQGWKSSAAEEEGSDANHQEVPLPSEGV